MLTLIVFNYDNLSINCYHRDGSGRGSCRHKETDPVAAEGAQRPHSTCSQTGRYRHREWYTVVVESWLTTAGCPQVPMARASILWLIGEYCHLIPKISPDVLRKTAKSFTTEVCRIGLYHCRILLYNFHCW